ncbi:MAG: bifunctional diaminohydroxyphosphoribosylaminopyrimidine deaminase/5-amino-6-(5-phosphoribosylamino)uracil reductase RibD [Ilumatobacteraceae bacterium]
MTEREAMLRALELAAQPGLPLGPNPRVGCVLLSPSGDVVAEGWHRGAGTPHAEADALARAGRAARGTTAVVTLEPCNHTGRTGPCAAALIEAGVRRVVYAHGDPNPVASGGAASLRAAGIEVAEGLLADEARRINRGWLHGLAHDRPFVTWKFATTLDGYSAAADGTSKWISNSAARRDVHRLRLECDVVLAGTSTVLTDDPQLSARGDDGQPLARELQPLRAVMGLRPVPQTAKVLDDSAETVVLATRDLTEALTGLFGLGRRHVLLEGGPTLAAAFMAAGLVDEVVAYVAPVLLGAGQRAVADLGIGTIADALRLRVTDTAVLWDVGEEPTMRLTLEP